VQLAAAIDTLAGWGEPSYRGAQLRTAVTRDLVRSFDEVTTLPRALRERLAAEVVFDELALDDERRSGDGTVKARFLTHDGFPVETVLMSHNGRRTVCVSSQSGCALACSFCATGAMGLGRNLAAGEIFEQLLWASRLARSDEARIDNVVLMGMGEPFMNYDAVLGFCRLANGPACYGLGARSMAISTAGWVPGIDRLAGEGLQVKLALSLHAPNDELRSTLMPVTRRFGILEVMAACARYRAVTRRRVYVEYLLLDGVNDTPGLAEELASLLRRTAAGGFHVNLIVYNPTEAAYRPSSDSAVTAFRAVLARRGIQASLRRSRGREIDAACGQLAVRGVRERRAELRAAR